MYGESENFHLTLYIQCVHFCSQDPLVPGNIEKIMESSHPTGDSKLYYDTKRPCMLKLKEFVSIFLHVKFWESMSKLTVFRERVPLHCWCYEHNPWVVLHCLNYQ